MERNKHIIRTFIVRDLDLYAATFCLFSPPLWLPDYHSMTADGRTQKTNTDERVSVLPTKRIMIICYYRLNNTRPNGCIGFFELSKNR